MSSFSTRFKHIFAPYRYKKGGETPEALTSNQSRSGRGSGDETSTASTESGRTSLGVGEFPSPILNMDSQVVNLLEFPSDAEPDQLFEESELGSVEGQKHIVLHILSQLKFGMDLTKIVLPTFILEKRSLLEMFADYMAHPDLFIAINHGKDPEARMLAFLHWYLTAFHSGHKDRIAKKPYNPIIGESFHCSWSVPQSSAEPLILTTDSDVTAPTQPDDAPVQNGYEAVHTRSDSVLLVYHAEQVSHHPPISAFHFECAEYQMYLDAYVYPKSKFHGMSISATLSGKSFLRLGQHNGEEYHFSFPTAYARSILSVPWIELGDKVNIQCPQTGYSATVVFHTKPIRASKLHRITAELFCPSGSGTAPVMENSNERGPLIARVSGQWNGVLEFEHLIPSTQRWSVDVNNLPVSLKSVRPIPNQRPEESRRLWHQVTEALRVSNQQLATEKKRELEERQRTSEKYRARQQIPFPVKYFEWNGSCWILRRPTDLQIEHS